MSGSLTVVTVDSHNRIFATRTSSGRTRGVTGIAESLAAVFA